MRRASNKHSLLHLAAALALAATGLFSACKGPSNPEPILGQIEVNTGLMSMEETAPDQVALTGMPGAVVNADRLQVVNLDRGEIWETGVNEDDSFVIVLSGMEIERYRLTAMDTENQRYEEAFVTGDPGSEGVIDIPPPERGCLFVDPPHLDMGTTQPGQPLYGEVVVTNDCLGPIMVLGVSVNHPWFTPVTLLTDGPMEPGASGVISVTFLSPDNAPQEAVLSIDVENPEPNPLPLIVTLRAAATP